MDKLSSRERSLLMVKGKNTKPELAVRRLLHSLGYRFRLHRKDLPGCPDIVLPKHRTVIFVHGCFWHNHKLAGCRGNRMPASNTAYWISKIGGNVKRDQRNRAALKAAGWKTLIIWECELKNLDRVEKKLVRIFSV